MVSDKTFGTNGQDVMRTITWTPPVVPERLHGGRAVLEAVVDHAWESRVVLNPAAVLVESEAELEVLFEAWGLDSADRVRLQESGGACVMLYRAQGQAEREKHHAPSYLGLAVFTPELEFVWRRSHPVILPAEPFHNLGVEDARCTRIGDTYLLYYTGYATKDPEEPTADRRVRICLATTRNFMEWDLRGPVAGDVNDFDNKNAALLPETVGGKWLLLHRPMEGPDAMAIHLAEARDPGGPWISRGLLMRSHRYHEFERSWIGGGGPPVPIGDGRFVMIYHLGHFTSDGDREYDLAAGLLDFGKDPVVRARIEPLMRPDAPGEQLGDAELGVDNVLFTCANYVWRDRLIIPYAGADSRIFGASVDLAGLVGALEGAG